MSGTGNILLKRGTTIPYAHQATEAETASILPKAMPAVQIEGLSYTYDYNASNVGPYARENYQNRLWMGMYGYAATNASIPTAETITSVGQLPVDAWTPNTTGVSRPLWMGAEIRAFIPLKDDTGTDTYFTILKADWNRPSDMVLVTQKAIAYAPVRSYALGTLGTTTGSVDIRKYVEFSVPVHNTGEDAWTGVASKKLELPTSTPSVGDALTVSTVTSITSAGLGEQDHTKIVLTWAAAGAGTPSAVTLTPTNDTSAAHFLTFTDTATGVEEIRTDTDLTYNPGTNTLTAVNFTGALSGTATNATNAAVTQQTTSGSYPIPFINSAGATTTGNYGLGIDSVNSLHYNPSTDMLNITNISKSSTITAGDQFVLFGTATNGLQYHGAGADIFRFNPGENGGTLYVKNLIVSGTETISQKTTIDLTDTYIRLNSDLVTTPTENGGISLNRGIKATPELRFNESTDRWEIVAPLDDIAINTSSGIVLSGTANNTIFTVNHASTGTVRKLLVGNTVRITDVSGGDTARYNGVWYIDTVPTSSSFTVAYKTHNITNMTFQAGGSYLVTVSAAHFPVDVGQQVVISNTSEPNLRGTFVVVGTGTLGALANPTTTAFYIAAGTGSTAITDEGISTGGTVTVHINDNYNTTSISTSSAKVHTTVSYPIVHTSASNTDNTTAALASSTGGQPIQTIYNAKLVDPVLENLTLSGSTLAIGLSAYITSLFDIQDGGLILPHMNAGSPNNFMDLASPSANTLVGRTEGNIAYDVTTNRIMYARGSSTLTTGDEDYNSGGSAVNTTMAELVDTNAIQTLTNKTWNSVVIAGEFGGTGVNNKDKTITLGGNLALVSGAFTTTLNATASTNVTLPVSGTLYGTATGSITSANLLGSMSDETGSGLLVFGTSPTFTTSVLSASASTTFDVFNTNATTINAFGAATNLIMGAAGALACITTIRGGTLVGGSNSTTQNVFNTVATTVNAFGVATAVNIGAAGSIVTLANNLTVVGNNIFFKSTTGNRITLTAAAAPTTIATHTLPNITSGNVVIANSSTNFNDSTYILTGGGTTTPSVYKDPATIVVGGVKVNFQNSIATAARYPIPFLGSNRVADGSTDPSAIFSAVADGSYLDSYLYANMSTSTGTAAGAYNNLTTGLFYEVNDTSGSGIGTLFCDFIGATLDCGSYN